MNPSFEGRVVCITGATRGIGLETARLCAAQGAKLALCARNGERLRTTGDDLRRRFGVDVLAQVADVRDPPALAAFFAAIGARYGHLDALVNNAGESSQRQASGIQSPVNAVDSVAQQLPAGRFEDMADAEWQEALDQKLMGPVRVIRAALPALRKSGQASIVNLASIKGRQPPPRVVTSGVAWAALMNLSKALSMELAADGIRVNVVSVGGILTDQMDAARKKWSPHTTLDDFLKPRVANIPLGRLGTADEVAQAIVFLASPQSSYVTGQCLAVDGGGLRSI